MIFRVMCFMLLASCSTGKNEKQPNVNPIDAIMVQRDLYLSLAPGVQDDYGWVHSERCDSALFSGLLDYSGGEVDIFAGRDQDTGQWYRTPYRDCYANQQADAQTTRRSKSTISRDMFAGILWSLYGRGDVAAFKRIIDYGKDNKWVMGQGPIDRTLFTPNFIETTYIGAEGEYSGPPYFWIDPVKDHQRHVVALNIVLRGEMTGEISDQMLDILKKFRDLEPLNALYEFGVARFDTGNYDRVYDLLDDSTYFPKDRLPDGRDRCGHWLWERSASHESWQPCGEEKRHSGGDYTFIATLLIKATSDP